MSAVKSVISAIIEFIKALFASKPPPPEPPHPVSPSQTAEQEAAQLAAPFEGFVSHPYQDTGGVWSIGYGSTRDADENPITANTPSVTEEQARALMARDLGKSAAEIQRDVKVQLSDNEKAALEDFIYNVGQGNFHSSTLLRKLNAQDFAGAAAEFDRWDHAGGKVLAGLLKRREAEKSLFLSA